MKKVMIVESDAVAARRMGSFWEGEGYEARLVTDRRQAAVEAGAWRPDLITLDLEDAEAEGAEVLRQFLSRPQTCRTPVVLLSGSAGQSLPAVLLRSVRAIIRKPFGFDRLLQGALNPANAA